MAPDLQNLKESNEFLNLLLDNINSAVLIADENLQIHQFNNSFLSLFDSAADGALESGFGEATGCINEIMNQRAAQDAIRAMGALAAVFIFNNRIDTTGGFAKT